MDIFPKVYTKITKSLEIPTSLDEINNDCDFIRYLFVRSYNKFIYKTINDTNSSKVLKKLIFIGNYDIERPIDEFIEGEIGFSINTMKLINYEERKIRDYVNLRNKSNIIWNVNLS